MTIDKSKTAISKKPQPSESTQAEIRKPPWSLWTASSYAIVMVLIGLPLWWKTTTVHRASLPYNDMLTLHELFDASSLDSTELDTAGLPLSAGYDILLTLLVPEPEVFDATWMIQQGIDGYLQPISKLNNFADFTIRSQILYYAKLNFRPKLNKQTGIHEVSYDQLPTVINPVESKLTSFVSQNPVVNFIVYVSPCSSNPMQILNEDGTFIESNGFFVPQWGGIQLYNGPCSSKNENETEPHEIFMHGVMSTIIPQFRALIGVQKDTSQEAANLDLESSLLDSELSVLLKKRLTTLQFTAANTLNSLGKLLDQITNIVVRDEVGEEVERSVNALKLSYSEAQKGNLEEALRQALISYKSSEIAFHHPSNLAQLYFPDDQKYAIYIPLFLPVGIPVLLSLRSIFAILKPKKS